MARQIGSILLAGSIGDIIFYKNEFGYFAKSYGRISKSRIKNDPVFQRTRNNSAEFGKAAKSKGLVRRAFNILAHIAADKRNFHRLISFFLRIIKLDPVNAPGNRSVTHSDLKLLEGFDFNEGNQFMKIFRAPFMGTIDRVPGKLSVVLPSFVPAKSISKPKSATHFKIISGGSALDFDSMTYQSAFTESEILPFDAFPTAEIELVNQVTANSPNPLFLVLGIVFYEQAGLRQFMLQKSYNTLNLVGVEVG